MKMDDEMLEDEILEDEVLENKALDDEMLDDYSHLPFKRNDGRFSREKMMNAPIYVVGKDGVRRRKASLHQLEGQFYAYPTQDFEVIVEALKIIARERGEEAAQIILAQCESELTKLRQPQGASALASAPASAHVASPNLIHEAA
jgi:hypothetical protein